MHAYATTLPFAVVRLLRVPFARLRIARRRPGRRAPQHTLCALCARRSPAALGGALLRRAWQHSAVLRGARARGPRGG